MPRRDKPNVLVIMSDQHSPHVLGCYGNEIVRTPNLDRLAGQGMRFTNAYCPSPLCVPSRMSFMTSRMPSRNRVWDNAHVLSSGTPTWAHRLGSAGYETALIGRMHFTGSDHRHGFEKRPLGEFSARHPGVPFLGGPLWTQYRQAATGQSRVAVETAGTGTTVLQWYTEKAISSACQYIREKAKAQDDRPFAAVCGFSLPHCPFIAPKALFEHYYDRIDIPAVESDQPATVLRFRRIRGILDPPLSEERVRVARAAYFALCEHVDRLLGDLFETLQETGLAENTLVIYCSDHGEMAGEHGCWWKSNYYEGSARVPLIARLPGAVPAGFVCDAVCNLVDLGPTFADIAGTRDDLCGDGRSLWPTLRGRHPEDWLDETFSELADFRGAPPVFPSRMIRSGPWKLWAYADEDNLPPVLFDLEHDPGEEHDLGQTPDHAGIRGELLRKVYEGWDPQRVSQLAEEGFEDYKTLQKWGKTVRPHCPDTVRAPPPALESDIELL